MVCHSRAKIQENGPNGGVDGTFNFPLGKIKGKQEYGKAIAQVKGGNYIPGHIRDFRTAIRNEKADLGVFIVTYPPTDLLHADRSGSIYIDLQPPKLRVLSSTTQIYEIQDYRLEGIYRNYPMPKEWYCKKEIAKLACYVL